MTEKRWSAVLEHKKDADGRFVYAVKTTGIFCRPSCSARRPKQKNVEFYEDAQSAVLAGFRPCLRCEPDQASEAERNAEIVADLCRFIENSAESPTLHQLALRAGFSTSHTHRLFKRVTGITPAGYAAAHRESLLRNGLQSDLAVTDAMYRAGYGSTSHFYEDTRKVLGMKPSQYRKGGFGLKIKFAVGECSLGSVLVAATEHGVCSISLGSDAEALVNELEKRFHSAELIAGDSDFDSTVASVVALIENPGSKVDLPLDIQGTIFQRRVWKAISQIPAGKTMTYSKIAELIGSPGAVRAVASACASNPLAIAIPCHRVVRTGGGLAGYRWGMGRKQELLRRESSGE